MPRGTIPTVTANQGVRASWGNQVKANDDDHETRVLALEAGGGTGDVVGPASSTDNEIPRYNGTGGKTLQGSGITIADGASGVLGGTNSGDVTLAGSPNYLTLAAQVITRALIDLASHITGRLPFANLTAATAANRLLGRGSAGGAGDFQEIALGTGLSFSGNTLNAAGGAGVGALDDLSDVVITTPAADHVLQHDGSSFVNKAIVNVNATNLASGTVPAARMPALTGDVTTSVGAVATAVANDAVTNAKLANMAAGTYKMRVTGSTGDPEDGTTAQATAGLNAVVGDSGSGGTKGLVPAPGSGDAAAGKFLKADGTFAVPAGGSASDSFKTIAVSGQSDVVADSSTDTLTLVAGTNVTLTTNAGSDTITIAASGGGSGDETTTAAEASKPAASNDGNLFLPNNGFYLWRDTGAVWAPWGPLFPMTPPVDGDFGWINQGAASVVTTNGGIYLTVPDVANQYNLRLRKKAVPATPYTVTTAMLPIMGAGAHVGMAFRQSSDGKLQILMIDALAGGVLHYWISSMSSATGWAADYGNGNLVIVSPVLWLRLADDGTNKSYQISADGVNFITLFSHARTVYSTPDEVGFYINSTNVYVGTTLLSWKEA